MKEYPNKLLIHLAQLSAEELVLEGQLSADVLGLDDEALSCPNPIDYKLRVQLLSASLLVQGRVSTTIRCRCDRCLSYDDHLVKNDQVTHYQESVTQETVDLTEDLREDIVISFPQKFLCSPDCRGLCPVCGQNLNTRSCDCDTQREGSTVWDQLDGLDL